MSKSATRKNQQTQQNQLRLRKVSPLTQTQKDVFEAYEEGLNLFLYGCAGTGKSLCVIYLALREVMRSNSPYHRLLIVRSAVPSRDIGFLPGTPKEKLEIYEAPYTGMFNWLFERGDAWKIAQTKGLVEVTSTSYMRGLTLTNCIIIVDECQNMNYEELATVITRAGNDTKIIFCGDLAQNDLYRKHNDTSGMAKFHSVIEEMDSMESIEFGLEDVVRSGICKDFIYAEHRVNNPGIKRAS